MTPGTLLGMFADGAAAARAVHALRADGFEALEVRGPVPHPAIEAALGGAVSPVRRYTLLGGLLGCASGFALTSWTALQWNLIVGGKPVVALVPFVVIAFELTVLFGAVATLLGFLVHGGLPRLRGDATHDPRLTHDRFGLVVHEAGDRLAAAEAALRRAGAEEVRRG